MVTFNNVQVSVLNDFWIDRKVDIQLLDFVDSVDFISLQYNARFGRMDLVFTFSVTCENGALFTFEDKVRLSYKSDSSFIILAKERRCLSCVEEEDVEDFAGVEEGVPTFASPEADIVFRNAKSPEYFYSLLHVYWVNRR